MDSKEIPRRGEESPSHLHAQHFFFIWLNAVQLIEVTLKNADIYSTLQGLKKKNSQESHALKHFFLCCGYSNLSQFLYLI